MNFEGNGTGCMQDLKLMQYYVVGIQQSSDDGQSLLSQTFSPPVCLRITNGKKITNKYKQGQGNWYFDVTLCLAIKIDTELRSILVLCEIETALTLARPARSTGFPLVT